jgi:YidC/Oxa1 family membrane protein insertase
LGLDRNTVIGITLLMLLFFVYTYINAPSKEEMAERQRVMDSIALAEQTAIHSDSLLISEDIIPATDISSDSLSTKPNSSVNLPEKIATLENDFLSVSFSSKGGRINSVNLKDYKRIVEIDKKDVKEELRMLEDKKNKFEYIIPLEDGRIINTGKLDFAIHESTGKVKLEANAGSGYRVIQTYTIDPDNYVLDYDLSVLNANNRSGIAGEVELNWVNFLEKLEKNTQYERMYSSVYWKEVEDDPNYCNCRKDAQEDVVNSIKWVSHSNQYFNTTLIANTPFSSAKLESKMLEEEDEDLKLLRSNILIPEEGFNNGTAAMKMYLGPNEFNRLRDMGDNMEDIIPYGKSILGTINRWVVRPMFDFIFSFAGSMGLSILILTFFIKLLLSPLSFKMYHSQAKMGVLKPEMAKLKEKHKDDQQKQQVETMQLYREFGVNPLGGCMPMLLQMPIWIALYRFFPAAIGFRQASFLWADDLSSYDSIMSIPNIPFYGDHISLFTILWAASLLVYNIFMQQNMDMGAAGGQNAKMMKTMQYVMPIMFLPFFNNYASGLTAYLTFSSILNILQTVGIKKFMLDEDKIRRQLEKKKAKPKKKGGFQSRLEQAMKDQQNMAKQKKK